MTRWWNEFVAGIGDAVPLTLVLLLLVLAATVAALLWYFFPAWVPRRRPRWRLRRRWWRPRRKRTGGPADPEPGTLPDDEVPELPAHTFADLADRLAAAGRYAEAVRERLRGMVRELIEHGVLEHRPGWTVTELAAAAVDRRPAVAGPLNAAADRFSAVWYGNRPADAELYGRMKADAERLRAALGTVGTGAR